jgi:hypothetical protein
MFVFVAGVVWVGIHWVPLASAIGAGALLLMMASVFVLLPIWFVLRLIADNVRKPQP